MRTKQPAEIVPWHSGRAAGGNARARPTVRKGLLGRASRRLAHRSHAALIAGAALVVGVALIVGAAVMALIVSITVADQPTRQADHPAVDTDGRASALPDAPANNSARDGAAQRPAELTNNLAPGSEHDGRQVFTVTDGTAARRAAGEVPDVFPETVIVRLDESGTVVIANDDSEAFAFGSTFIEPGQQLTQQFTEPGVYVFMCGVHPGGQLRFVVLGSDGTILGQ